ncbi:MAG TPA: hypothetical protein VHV79_07705 [Mycobacteriales bacterium]|jgi:hypothetical protein|nr:hypothetical protein [Mycobacteriales bacterium]
MTAFLVVIIVLGTSLLCATAYMEWIGLMSLITPRSGPHHESCGHLRINALASQGLCWRCRHSTADRALHALHH